ncbi:MAG: NADPH-dependent glutamate synthase, partial [Anaerolineaceae bacterium]|nr:NADPH-dependent glutamate synthase [Anaerolineaceae bacterium]
AMLPGEVILDIVGPLGNPSDIELYGTVVIIGGGVGTGVAFPNAVAMKEAGNRTISIIGGRSKEYVILEKELTEICDTCYVCTDDGSYGYHGFVTGKLQDLIDAGEKIDYVLCVGPLPMMRAVAEVTRPYNIKTVASLNTIMVDGTGMCGGCRATVGGKTVFACVDGPEFDAHQVDFKVLMNRSRAFHTQEEELVHICRAEKATMTVKERMKIPRNEMPEQVPELRATNFDEVSLGFTPEQAINEAERCLQCKNPQCVPGCPVNIKIPEFIKKISEGKFLEAAAIIEEDNVLGIVCGRVCPQSDQCEGVCILEKRGEAVAIGALERFVTDYKREKSGGEPVQPPEVKKTGRKVAIVGSGPASLSCAGDLIRKGHEVVVFEALHEFGGVLAYGIPEFRLPKQIVREEVQHLSERGVTFRKNVVIGQTFSIDDLRNKQGFDAVFVGAGAGLPRFMSIPGEELVGVYSANEFLTRVNLMKAYQFPRYETPVFDCHNKRIAVVGGGNTAMDSARVALRMGAAEVYIIYRRTHEEMPARKEEVRHGIEEGLKFLLLHNPIEFIGDEKGWLKRVLLQRMEMGEADESGRRRPIPIEGDTTMLDIDAAIIAIGNGSNPILVRSTPDLEFNSRGNIIADDETQQTNMEGVYAGGDIVTGGATVILAMGAGRKAAAAIDNYLKELDRRD